MNAEPNRPFRLSLVLDFLPGRATLDDDGTLTPDGIAYLAIRDLIALANDAIRFGASDLDAIGHVMRIEAFVTSGPGGVGAGHGVPTNPGQRLAWIADDGARIGVYVWSKG